MRSQDIKRKTWKSEIKAAFLPFDPEEYYEGNIIDKEWWSQDPVNLFILTNGKITLEFCDFTSFQPWDILQNIIGNRWF